MKKYLKIMFMMALLSVMVFGTTVHATEPSTEAQTEAEEDEKVNYAVKYNLDGGVNDEENLEEYESGTEVILEGAAKDGYYFAGWYTDENCTEGNLITSIPADNTDDIELWAKWTLAEYTITYVISDGMVLSEDPKTTYTFEDDDFELPTVEYGDQIFIGWCQSISLNDTPITSITKGTTGNLWLYPKFITEAITFTSDGFNCSLGYGGVQIEKGTFQDNVIIPETIAYNGVDYLVADIADNAFSDAINVVSIIFPSSIQSVSLVNFDNCSSLKDVIVKSKVMTIDSLPRVVNVTAYYGSMAAEDFLDLEFTGTLTYFTVNITLVVDGGSISSATSFDYRIGEQITLEEPTKASHIFDGWYTTDTFESDSLCYENAFYTEDEVDVTIYAKWIKERYSIVYNLDGGVNSKNNTDYYVYGVGLILSNPTKSGYRFDGWYEDAAFTKKIKRITSFAEQDYVLYAKWVQFGSTEGNNVQEAGEFKITYHLNGGKNSDKNPTSYNRGQEVVLKAPTRKGYKFSYWCSDSKLKRKITKIAAGTTGDVNVYAKWTKITVKKNSIKSLVNKKGKKLQVKFSKVSGVAGYQLQYSTSKKFTKKTTKSVNVGKKKSTYTSKKLKAGKTYYVRMRGYKKDSTGAKVYGKWSAKKTIKIVY